MFFTDEFKRDLSRNVKAKILRSLPDFLDSSFMLLSVIVIISVIFITIAGIFITNRHYYTNPHQKEVAERLYQHEVEIETLRNQRYPICLP